MAIRCSFVVFRFYFLLMVSEGFFSVIFLFSICLVRTVFGSSTRLTWTFSLCRAIRNWTNGTTIIYHKQVKSKKKTEQRETTSNDKTLNKYVVKLFASLWLHCWSIFHFWSLQYQSTLADIRLVFFFAFLRVFTFDIMLMSYDNNISLWHLYGATGNASKFLKFDSIDIFCPPSTMSSLKWKEQQQPQQQNIVNKIKMGNSHYISIR